ncbi:hypothetical protein ACU686_36560 [Yinghuangia aomiensis]
MPTETAAAAAVGYAAAKDTCTAAESGASGTPVETSVVAASADVSGDVRPRCGGRAEEVSGRRAGRRPA